MKECILTPGKECNDCGECDKYCMYDPSKLCDNCFKCLEVDTDFAEIDIDEIENPVKKK